MQCIRVSAGRLDRIEDSKVWGVAVASPEFGRSTRVRSETSACIGYASCLLSHQCITMSRDTYEETFFWFEPTCDLFCRYLPSSIVTEDFKR